MRNFSRFLASRDVLKQKNLYNIKQAKALLEPTGRKAIARPVVKKETAVFPRNMSDSLPPYVSQAPMTSGLIELKRKKMAYLRRKNEVAAGVEGKASVAAKADETIFQDNLKNKGHIDNSLDFSGERSNKSGPLTKNQVDTLVNDIGGTIKRNPLRQEYESAVSALKNMEFELRTQRLSEESIARELSQARRDLGTKYKDLTPSELREYIYDVNIGRYKDPLGPKFEDLVKRYDGDYSKIIEASQRPHPNVDNLLGGFKEWLLKKNGL